MNDPPRNIEPCISSLMLYSTCGMKCAYNKQTVLSVISTLFNNFVQFK